MAGRKPPKGKTLISFYADTSNLEKMKNIALASGLEFSEVYNTAFEKLIKLYEAKHGKVKVAKPKKLDL